MDERYEFDAPQFVDFTQPQAHEMHFNDSWFDRHTEEDDFLIKNAESGTNSAEKRQMKKPQRILKGGGTADDKGKEKAEFMEVDKKSSRALGPSPKKRQKLSNDGQHVLDSSPPAANTRSQTSTPAAKQEVVSVTEQECPAASIRSRSPCNEKQTKSPNPRMPARVPNRRSQSEAKSPNKRFQAIKTFVKKIQGKSPNRSKGGAKKTGSVSPRKPLRHPNPGNAERGAKVAPQTSGLQRSQSLRTKMPTKAVSTGSLFTNSKKETEKRSSGNSDISRQGGRDSKNPDSKNKSTEQLEMEKIAAMKEEVARTRKLAEESYKKAMTAQGYIPKRSAQPSTLPQGFHFQTDQRLKNPQGPSQEHKVKDFTKSLREALPHSTLPTKPQIAGLTRPQPFKLSSAKSTNSLPSAQKYESVAERVAAFHKKTPDRFRSQPGAKERSRSATKQDTSGHDRRLRSQSPKLTIAKTPQLMTRGRHRPVHAMSREEKEQMEYEEHQKQQFKAHPVNPRVFNAPEVPKVEPKSLTVPEEFNFQHKKSMSVGDLRSSAMETDDEKFEFHAKPVNPRILAGPVGVKPVEPRPVTVPESPAFALKNRVRMAVQLPKQDEPKVPVKVNPVPYTGVPFRPRLAHHCTVPEPFSVEERSKEMLTRREQKIQQILEEERKAHEFHANDLPSDSPDALPPKQVRPVTKPEPFHLEVDERGQKYKEEFKSKLEEEERAALEAARFKARPNDVIYKEPFQPQKSSKPLTEISDFALNTDTRATQREAFDQHLKAREAELEAFKRQREERLEEEEKARIAAMRMEAVHKATGIKKYKSVIVKSSDKPLTEPQSPRFSQRTRAKHNTSNDV